MQALSTYGLSLCYNGVPYQYNRFSPSCLLTFHQTIAIVFAPLALYAGYLVLEIGI